MKTKKQNVVYMKIKWFAVTAQKKSAVAVIFIKLGIPCAVTDSIFNDVYKLY